MYTKFNTAIVVVVNLVDSIIEFVRSCVFICKVIQTLYKVGTVSYL
jgi:hypothetical protein